MRFPARKRIARTFLKEIDQRLDADDVIQNKEWKGYRLNPYLLLVKRANAGGAPLNKAKPNPLWRLVRPPCILAPCEKTSQRPRDPAQLANS